MEQLCEIVQPGMTVWDCGTYIGYYTIFFARRVGPSGRVVAVEPDPRNRARTEQNLSLNGLTNVNSQDLAIAGATGVMNLLLSDDTNSHLEGGYWVGAGDDRERWARREGSLSRLPIQCSTLDDAFFERQLPKPDLIKLDIEGAEKDALLGTSRLVASIRPLFVIELHNPECDKAAWQWAQACRYRLFSLDSRRVLTEPDSVCGTLLCTPEERDAVH
ncbi:MAG: FkbM family methyltransferase [Bryobacteraceae bacterium]